MGPRRLSPSWVRRYDLRRPGSGDHEVSIGPMVTLARLFIGKQSEEQKYVADTDALFAQMTLRAATLAEPAPSVGNHRVIVAMVVTIQSASGHFRN